MVLFICVDDRFGMCFNQRRLSRDRAVIEKMIELAEGKSIWMESYSVPLFPKASKTSVDNDFLQKASAGDYCFVERVDVARCMNRVEKLFLFHWNRKYPADLFFPKTMLVSDWKMVESVDFPGTSHDTITMKVYIH